MILFLFYPGQSSTLRRWEGGGRAAECDELTRRQQEREERRGEFSCPLTPPPASPGLPCLLCLPPYTKRSCSNIAIMSITNKNFIFQRLSPPLSSIQVQNGVITGVPCLLQLVTAACELISWQVAGLGSSWRAEDRQSGTQPTWDRSCEGPRLETIAVLLQSRGCSNIQLPDR